ncbi:MAG: DUF6891 domain-containing protein [Methanosarcinales archaeon]
MDAKEEMMSRRSRPPRGLDNDVRDQMIQVLKKLRRQGFIARANFSCCSSCASHELSSLGKERLLLKAVYWHGQDQDRGVWDGSIRYFHLENDDPQKVGQEIAATLDKFGLAYDWNGESNKIIKVTGFAQVEACQSE